MSCNCAICDDKVSKNEPKLCSCSYHFHVKCLRKWYYHSEKHFSDIKCPCCRRKIPIWKNTRKKLNYEDTKKIWRDKIDKCSEAETEIQNTQYIVELFDFIWDNRNLIRSEKTICQTVKNKLLEMKTSKRPEYRKTYQKMKNF